MEPARRKVVTRSPARTVRLLNLNGLLQEPVEAESSLEADAVRRIALWPSVISMKSQPFVLTLHERHYTPDYLVHTKAGLCVVIEIKIDHKLADYVTLLNKAAIYLAQQGYQFLVLTEKTLRQKKVHARASLLLRYAKASFPQSEIDHLLEYVVGQPPGIPLGGLVKRLSTSRELIYHLIAHKRLTTGPRLQLDDSALVFHLNTLEKEHANSLADWLGVTPWPTHA